MGEVYIVLEYVDDMEAQPVSILGVYTHEEQAMKHALTLVDAESIGLGSTYVDPPAGNTFDAHVHNDDTKRIAIVASPFTVGINRSMQHVSTVKPKIETPNSFAKLSLLEDIDEIIDLDDPFHPEYDSYNTICSDQFSTEFEL